MANGLLDFMQTPAGLGLLGAVAGGFAGARRGTPFNNVGRGLLGGVASYGNALDREQQAQQFAAQEQDRAQGRELRELQMAQARAQMEREQGQQKWREGLPNAIQQSQAQYGAGEEGPTMTPGNPNALRDYAMLPNSPFADDILQRQLFPKAADTKVVGDTLLALENGGVRELYRAPAKPEAAPSSVREYQYGQADPAFNAWLLNNKKAGANNVNVDARNIHTQEGEQSKVYGKGLGEMRLEIQNAGYQAPRTITQVERMNELLQGVEGGSLANAGLQIANFANSLGFKIDPKLGDKQAAESLAVEMALSMRKAGTGPMTDKDFENFAKAVPNLAKTAEGRAQISATLVAKAERDMQIAAMARDYAQKNNGVIDDRFLSEVSQFIANNPVAPKQQATSNDGWSVRRK